MWGGGGVMMVPVQAVEEEVHHPCSIGCWRCTPGVSRVTRVGLLAMPAPKTKRRGRTRIDGIARSAGDICGTCGYRASCNSALLAHLACTHQKEKLATAFRADIKDNLCGFCGFSVGGKETTIKSNMIRHIVPQMIRHIASTHQKVLDYVNI